MIIKASDIKILYFKNCNYGNIPKYQSVDENNIDKSANAVKK